MKNLKKKIFKKIYLWETRRLIIDFLLKIIVFLSSFLFFLILGDILFNFLKEQRSFELLDFFQEDFEVIKKYFFDNVFIFWLEIPKFLLLLLFLSLGISSIIIILFIKNFNIYKNKIKNIYQWFLKQK